MGWFESFAPYASRDHQHGGLSVTFPSYVPSRRKRSAPIVDPPDQFVFAYTYIVSEDDFGGFSGTTLLTAADFTLTDGAFVSVPFNVEINMPDNNILGWQLSQAIELTENIPNVLLVRLPIGNPYYATRNVLPLIDQVGYDGWPTGGLTQETLSYFFSFDIEGQPYRVPITFTPSKVIVLEPIDGRPPEVPSQVYEATLGMPSFPQFWPYAPTPLAEAFQNESSCHLWANGDGLNGYGLAQARDLNPLIEFYVPHVPLIGTEIRFNTTFNSPYVLLNDQGGDYSDGELVDNAPNILTVTPAWPSAFTSLVGLTTIPIILVRVLVQNCPVRNAASQTQNWGQYRVTNFVSLLPSKIEALGINVDEPEVTITNINTGLPVLVQQDTTKGPFVQLLNQWFRIRFPTTRTTTMSGRNYKIFDTLENPKTVSRFGVLYFGGNISIRANDAAPISSYRGNFLGSERNSFVALPLEDQYGLNDGGTWYFDFQIRSAPGEAAELFRFSFIVDKT